MLWLKRLLVFATALGLSSCGATSLDTLNFPGGGEPTKATKIYTVMPEQQCSRKHVGLKLIKSEVVHPSAKLCFYS